MKKSKLSFLFLLPTLIIILSTVIYPVIKSFLFSLQKYKLTEPATNRFIGLDNYKKIFRESDFYTALTNSILVVLFTVIIAFVASIIVGLMLNQKYKITPILTAIAIIPWALPPIVNGIINKFVFYPGHGLVNKVLIFINVIDNPINWTANNFNTMFIASFVVAWKVVPFCAILILSTLQNIPSELYEAARIDGASSIQIFKNITFPLLSPTFAIVLIQIIMASINVFDEVVSIVGYRYDSATLLIYNYMHTFSFLDIGYGSSITYVIMIFSGIIGYFYIKDVGKEK